MSWDAEISTVGALLAEPARCRILLALADGRALPATTLAAEAHIAPSTASAHLGRLIDAGWLAVEPHGRHRYYRIAREEVGDVIEAAAHLAPAAPVTSLAADIRRRQLRQGRTCYGHLAGRLGVGLFRSLLNSGWLEGHDGTYRAGIDRLSAPGRDVVYRVTAAGAAGLADVGVQTAAGEGCRHCVDWTEQRHHLAGHVGAALATRLLEMDWIARRDGRIVEVTDAGAKHLQDLGFDIETLDSDRAGAAPP